MDIRRFEPLAGSPAEPLWFEGENSYVLFGKGMHAAATVPPGDLIGWAAFVDGEPAALQACRVRDGEAQGLLSYCRPEYRQRGLFRAIQRQVDAALLAQGVTHIRSWVVDGPEAAGMAAAIVSRGGAKVGEMQVEATGGPVAYHVYLRPLRAD